ncbi:MAG: acyl carrier protein [Candidatus Aminicenantes bacterium]|nr:MAG: acyl carrier protein [Candidatus Aminicenantes bacterium]
MEIREKIREFIVGNLNDVEELAIFNDDENIFEMGLVNSLFAMKLLNYVESEFHVEVTYDDMEIENFSTVSNITKFIRQKEEVSNGQD